MRDTMPGGTLTINYGNVTVNVGTVTSWENSVQKRGSAYPIVSQGVQNSFPIENGNSQSYTFQFKHVNGQNGQTNAAWMGQMTATVDRWQARTDGCRLVYTSQNIYVKDMVLYGYIKSITLNYRNDFNEVITGTLTFTVGRMSINVDPEDVPTDSYPFSDMYVIMSDPERVNWYALYMGADNVNNTIPYTCIDSVEITAGPESPFEYAKITIPRKKLMEQIPQLTNTNNLDRIVDGRNKIYLNMMGNHDMFVQKVSSSGDKLTIIAYCDAQVYTQRTLTSSLNGRPMDIILSILKDSSLGVVFPDRSIIYKYDANLNRDATFTMPSGTSVYRALQICAKALRCRLFFADNCAYIIDYTVSAADSLISSNPTAGVVKSIGGLYLRGGRKLGDACVGESSTDETGFDPVKNCCTVSHVEYDDSGKPSEKFEDVYDTESVELFKTNNKGIIRLPELSADQARVFAQNMLYYTREPQRSMTFTLKESYPEATKIVNGQTVNIPKGWKSFFGPCAMASSIEDDYTSEKVDNTSAFGGKAYHKLILSEYTRHFPKGTCEYTFGMIASVELSDNLSQTDTALNS